MGENFFVKKKLGGGGGGGANIQETAKNRPGECHNKHAKVEQNRSIGSDKLEGNLFFEKNKVFWGFLGGGKDGNYINCNGYLCRMS